MRKPELSERIKKGEEQKKLGAVDKDKVLKMVQACLNKKKIEGFPEWVRLQEIDYGKYEINAENHIIWIEFTLSGHVAVVGAGKDYGFPKNAKTGTGFILKGLHEKWDESGLIIVPVKGLESVGIKNVDNILKCRNGVEHYIGEYLLEHKVPILNYYQHKNYSDKFWEKCKQNKYFL